LNKKRAPNLMAARFAWMAPDGTIRSSHANLPWRMNSGPQGRQHSHHRTQRTAKSPH